MGGKREDKRSDSEPARPPVVGPGAVEILEPTPLVSIRDSLIACLGDSLARKPADRPLHYAVTSSLVTCVADAPMTLQSPVGDGSSQSTWTVPFVASRTPLESPSQFADVALVELPTSGSVATLIDLIAAQCTSLIGNFDGQSSLLNVITRDLSGGEPDSIEVVAVGPVGPSYVQRVDTLQEACRVIVESERPLVILVAAELVETDGFERVVAAAERHDAAGVVACALHARARAVIASTEGGDCTVFVRPPTADVSQQLKSSLRATSRDSLESVATHDGVKVALLGPVEISGSHEPLGGHPLLTELVVYLAMHPQGATTSAWETALWPERRMPLQTVANRLSEARRALGVASDGRPRLRKSDDRHLIAEVSTDWDEFKLLADQLDDPAAWRAALDLVRGRPFADLHQGQWVTLEGFEIEIEHAIVDCALRLGRHALGCDCPDEAISAAQRALRATPWDERLHRLLMTASDAAGDRAGVEATFRHLALVLEIDGDPLHAVHPETARLYTRLSGRAVSPMTARI